MAVPEVSKTFLILPGGGIDEDELSLAGVKREMYEELKLRVARDPVMFYQHIAVREPYASELKKDPSLTSIKDVLDFYVYHLLPTEQPEVWTRTNEHFVAWGYITRSELHSFAERFGAEVAIGIEMALDEYERKSVVF
jgi:8-oxo-dGTP pyrophosphatase MutT (NUDIX family)